MTKVGGHLGRKLQGRQEGEVITTTGWPLTLLKYEMVEQTTRRGIGRQSAKLALDTGLNGVGLGKTLTCRISRRRLVCLLTICKGV